MKYLKSYNESVKDLMTPKSEEEIESGMKPIAEKVAKELMRLERDGLGMGIKDYEEAYKFVISKMDMVWKLVDEYGCVEPYKIAINLKYDARLFGFKDETNEGVRDKMTPKPDSQIKKELAKLPATKVLSTAKRNGVDIYDIFGEEDIKKLEHRIDEEFQEDMKSMKRKMNHLDDIYKGVMTETSSKGNDYQIELKFSNMSVYIRKEKDNEDFECGYELEPIGQTTRTISDWEEINNLNGCIDQLQTWLDNHWIKNEVNEDVRDTNGVGLLRSMMTSLDKNQILGKLEYDLPEEKLKKGVQNDIVWMVEEAIKDGVDVQMWDNWAIIHASRNGYSDLIKLLIDNGADVNSRDESALIFACEGNHIEVVKILLNNGADVHTLNDYPIRTAKNRKCVDVAEYLEEYINKETK